jgi:hypothetical protein
MATFNWPVATHLAVQVTTELIFLSTLPEKRLQMYFDDLQASQNLAWSCEFFNEILQNL